MAKEYPYIGEMNVAYSYLDVVSLFGAFCYRVVTKVRQ